jgi:hypothetical protein
MIGKQGVWCLRKDQSTANTSGSAITINTNNVTVDCNDFKIGELAAGNTHRPHIHAILRRQHGRQLCDVLRRVRFERWKPALMPPDRLTFTP